MLCYVDSNVRKRVLDYIFRDGKEAGSYGDVVLQKNAKIVNGQRKLRMKKFWRGSEEGRERKNANEENKEKTA